MSVIHLATARGLCTVGRAGADPLDGWDVTTLAAGAGALWALTRNRRIWRIEGGAAAQVARVEARSPGACSGTRARSGWAPSRRGCCVSTVIG